MSIVHSLLSRLRARRRHARTVGQLSALSDRQLADIGLNRFDIPRVARS